MDINEGDMEVRPEVSSYKMRGRWNVFVCACDAIHHPSRSPHLLVTLPLTPIRLLPQALESPHSSPSLTFRTPHHKRQSSDTHTLSDTVR